MKIRGFRSTAVDIYCADETQAFVLRSAGAQKVADYATVGSIPPGGRHKTYALTEVFQIKASIKHYMNLPHYVLCTFNGESLRYLTGVLGFFYRHAHS